jgi:N-acetylglucosaminyldiphosphoundecaprenol N-acetyl-beta-D-mannosaminyltransferase
MRVPLLGVAVDVVSEADAIARIQGWIERARVEAGRSARTRCVVTLNPEFVMAARRLTRFRAAILAADLITPDGIGVVWAARLAGARMRGRVAGVDLLLGLVERARANGTRIFLLGAAPGVAEVAAGELRRQYPGLMIAGTHAGSPAPEDDAETIERLTTARPDLLFVAYGAPAQELWIARLRDRLGLVGVACAIGVGGALDFVSGTVPRAPRWMRRLGLEWLYRLIRQPWRGRRMLSLPPFAMLALAAALRSRRSIGDRQGAP